MSYHCGFSCDRLSMDLYEKLMDRGWTRCGSYFYKPNLEISCCRPYIMRIFCDEYKPTNKNLKNWQFFLNFF